MILKYLIFFACVTLSASAPASERGLNLAKQISDSSMTGAQGITGASLGDSGIVEMVGNIIEQSRDMTHQIWDSIQSSLGPSGPSDPKAETREKGKKRPPRKPASKGGHKSRNQTREVGGKLV